MSSPSPLRQVAEALRMMVRLWDDNHADDPCACLGASPDCPSPPPCELCDARAALALPAVRAALAGEGTTNDALTRARALVVEWALTEEDSGGLIARVALLAPGTEGA